MGLRAPLLVAGCLQLVVAAISAERLAAVLTSPQRAVRPRPLVRLAAPSTANASAGSSALR